MRSHIGRRARVIAAGSAAVLLAACGSPEPDAYGNFEAAEVVVSAEVAGQLIAFAVAEGETLAPGALVGRIEVTTLELQRDELESQRGGTAARTAEAEAQIAVLQAQLVTATDEYDRVRRLFAAEAATAQQLDQAEGAVRVLRARIDAARAMTVATTEEAGGVEARIAQLEERIRKSDIVNPVAGTVLTRYAEAGEFVQPGQALYEIADLDPLTLRAYVSGAQLSSLRLGQSVEVRVDAEDGGMRTLTGQIASIASRAEFTPTPIQTREERTVQVYAVEIRVANPACVAKIGMPAEVTFTAVEEEE